MIRPASFLRNALIAAVLLPALAACGRGDDRAVDVTVIGEPSAPFAAGPRRHGPFHWEPAAEFAIALTPRPAPP